MLKDIFFTIKKQTTEEPTTKFTIGLNKDHAVYGGHFPEMPVVPGVCTLQMIKECAETVAGKSLRYANIANCKFSAMILPTEVQELEITATLQEAEIGFSLKAVVKNETTTYLTLKAELVEMG